MRCSGHVRATGRREEKGEEHARRGDAGPGEHRRSHAVDERAAGGFALAGQAFGEGERVSAWLSTIHRNRRVEAPSSLMSVGRATFSTVVSSPTTGRLALTTARVSHRRTGGSPVCGEAAT